MSYASGATGPKAATSSNLRTNLLASEKDRARDVAGCLVIREHGDLPLAGGVDAIVSHFRAACQGPEFASRWSDIGFVKPSFHPNTQLKQSSPAYEKFAAGLQNLHQSSALGVVFHGTASGNISNILQNGLDPSRRKGQAYGPGEYFSKEPGVSVSYCKGGLEMLVFVVILPSTIPDIAGDDTKESASDPKAKSQTRRALWYHAIPPDYVVVENNNHQIPIGTMKFESVDRNVVNISQSRRQKLMALSREVFAKSQVTKETQIKAKIIQDLIAGKVDTASRHYEKQRDVLKEVSKREISWYVRQNVEEEVICFYFEGLPEPLSPEEIANTKLLSLDDATKQEQEAKERLEAAQKAVPADRAARNEPRLAGSLCHRLESISAVAHSAHSGLHSATTGTGFSNLRLAVQRAHEANISALSSVQLGAGPQGKAASLIPSLTGMSSTPSSNVNPQENSSQSAAPSLASSSFSGSMSTVAPGVLETNPTADIIQHLIANRVDMASELYQKRKFGSTPFDCAYKKEIYLYAKPIVDASLVDALFPGLSSVSSPSEE